MEPTPNFAAGLAEARKQLAAEGKLSKEDDSAVATLMAKPVVVRPDGTRYRAMYRVHYRARNLYVKMNRIVLIGPLDWTKLVDWIKEHWFEIMRIVFTILPFIL